MKYKIYYFLPNVFQNLIISLFNLIAYKKRYGELYQGFRDEKKSNRNMSYEELKSYQRQRYAKFIQFAIKNSAYYNKTLAHIKDVADIDNISKLPITAKEDLRKNIDSIVAKTSENLEVSKTGGTTGKSLEVKSFVRNVQERFAFLDDFRSRYGYKLGEKTAWFSGKNLLTPTDVKKSRFWKTDVFYKVRYYSTFHIKEEYLKSYIDNLIKYKPKYMVGFPSTMNEIAKYGLQNGISFPNNIVNAIFPTAETTTEEVRSNLQTFFKANVYDQYASSEGAPFIFECKEGNLHMELQSGVFEVLDENDLPTQSGRLIVTSFTTEGTPLIRYDIGDSVTLENINAVCSCGNNNPLVKEIQGRIDDYIYSEENGKINLGNISNTLKDTEGIVKFQVIQNSVSLIQILIIVDENVYNARIEKKFIQNWRDRVGYKMQIDIEYVSYLNNEKSGKFRMVKNNITNKNS